MTCLDEEDGRLESICDIYISPDGATAYRYHPEDGSYRLLPEQGEFPGFDPESQSPEEVFRQANALCAAVYGELDFDSTAEPVTSAAGNFYPVSDRAAGHGGEAALRTGAVLRRGYPRGAAERLRPRFRRRGRAAVLPGALRRRGGSGAGLLPGGADGGYGGVFLYGAV